MPDILFDLPIKASAERVFQGVTTPEGLNSWWTKECSGEPKKGAEYKLWFGPEYDWRAVISRFIPNKEFELKVVSAHKDWQGTLVGFVLDHDNDITTLHFHHLGWPKANDHFRISSYCWALYLRLLKRYVETGAVVLYEDRDNA